MNLLDVYTYSKRGSGRTTRMLLGVIADAPNEVTIIGANRRHADELKSNYVRLGGNLEYVKFISIDSPFWGIDQFVIDHYALEELQRRHDKEVEDWHNQQLQQAKNRKTKLFRKK